MPDGGDRRALIERAFRAGIEVVAPDAAVKRVLRGTGDGFSVDGEAIPVRRRLLVVAIGKAASPMARAAADVLGDLDAAVLGQHGAGRVGGRASPRIPAGD